MAIKPQKPNRLQYILRTPKERRRFKKRLLITQKHLEAAWPKLSDPASDLTDEERHAMVLFVEFTKQMLDMIKRLDDKTTLS